ncbi:tubulin epsilon and delta complex protein 2 [Gastrophryne carolinensis]
MPLLPLLNQALHSCKEEERLLEEQLRQCRKLLADWKTDSHGTMSPGDPAPPQERQPSAEEVQEVELLNKALEKAFKVRGASRTESSKVPPVMQTAPSSSTTKDKTVKPLSKISHTGAKPVVYHLKAPYKTMPEKRRVRGPERAASGNKAALSTHVKHTTLEKGNDGRDSLAEQREITARTEHAPLKPSSPPSTTDPNRESLAQGQMKQQKALTLQDKGPTLKLPVEYRQEYIRNSRLWEKYYEIQAHLPASRPSFIQKLQTTFTPESPELSLSEIEAEAARLLGAVRSLEKRIGTASKWEGSGPTHWQPYRSLLMLEFLQDEVDKSHSELQKLEQVAEQYRKWSEMLSIDSTCPEVTLCPPVYRTSPPMLIYSHPDELCELTASRLRVMELQQRIYLQKVQSEELLAEADSQCGDPASSNLLFRALYTQLCEGGDLFPVLVQDDG